MLLNLSKNLQPPVSFDVHIIALGDGEQLCWVAGNLRRLKGLGGLGWYDLGTGAYFFPSLILSDEIEFCLHYFYRRRLLVKYKNV